MEETKKILKNLINESLSKDNLFKRNLIKEYLQILVLDFIYSHPEYSELFFYGGSCLAHCFQLPRLSEDLDFVDLKKRINLHQLSKDLEKFFKKNTDLDLSIVIQKFRIYLKFPLLKKLGLSKKGESDLLFLKIEIFNQFNFCRKYTTEIIPLFKFNKSILIKSFDLSTLMSTKIGAILYRKWEKTDKQGNIFIKIKGRDYFDLFWYLEKGVKPNLKCVEGVKNKKELKEKLLKIISKIDKKSIQLDLKPLLENQKLVQSLSKDIKNILRRQIIEKL